MEITKEKFEKINNELLKFNTFENTIKSNKALIKHYIKDEKIPLSIDSFIQTEHIKFA